MKLKQNISGSKKFFTFTGIPTLDFGTLEHSLLAVWTAKEYLYMKPLPQLAQKNFNSDVSGWATSKGRILYLKFPLNQSPQIFSIGPKHQFFQIAKFLHKFTTYS